MLGRPQALGLLWHTIHGLVDGPGEASRDGSTARQFTQRLFEDGGFVELAAEEMAEALSRAAAEHGLDWRPEPAPAEACAALGLDAAVDVAALAAAASDGYPPGVWGLEAAQEEAAALGGAEAAAAAEAGGSGLFQELMRAVVQLSAVPDIADVRLPPRLIGVVLTGNVALVDALHRLRFGAAAEAGKKKAPSEEATKASQARAGACEP